MKLSQKTIGIGICGGIACYKIPDLIMDLKEAGADVHVIMTENSTKFISPLTFETVSENPVHVDMFKDKMPVAHIKLAEMMDLFVIAPATANMLAKIASGTASDLISTIVVATKAPILIFPSMNVNMYENRVTQRNIRSIKELGHKVFEPDSGRLACGAYGKGRLPKKEVIIEEILSSFYKKDLLGETVLVTAGPTYEPIDPVRFISNYSSGKMGFAIAKVARRRGAKVILVTGPTYLEDPYGVECIRINTAKEMAKTVLDRLSEVTIVIKAAAVSDFRPKELCISKIKKRKKLSLELSENPDILKEISKRKGKRIVVGFALETENLIQNAISKLKEKNLDLIVANAVGEFSGFGKDTNKVKIIDQKGNVEDPPLLKKEEIADIIFDRILSLKRR